VEDCLALDVNSLNRDGCLSPGWMGTCTWNGAGTAIASIDIQTGIGSMGLFYQWPSSLQTPRGIEEHVDFVSVPCRFGGRRAYFFCPAVTNGVPCRRRVTRLYCVDGRFRCRVCLRLAYTSQRERALLRMIGRRNRLQKQLGVESMFAKPAKRKGMWHRTHEQLCRRLDANDRAVDDALFTLIDRYGGIENCPTSVLALVVKAHTGIYRRPGASGIAGNIVPALERYRFSKASRRICIMRVYHRTSNEVAKRILAEGFRDGGGSYLTEQTWRGVWVSDRAIDVNEGASGNTLLAMDVPIAIFEEYEWAEEGRSYRESFIPATTLNELGSGIGVVEDDE
jgi:hypothetical protein